MAHEVFISYSTEDQATADDICAEIEAHAARCWIASRDILPGSDWAEAISYAIGGAKIVVVIVSSRANQSHHVKREVERAVDGKLTIIPFRLDDAPLSGTLAFFLSTCQWLDAFKPPRKRHIQRLAESVAVTLSRNMHTTFCSGDSHSVQSQIGNTEEVAAHASERRAGS